MRSASPLPTRILLCASATHCAQVLHAAATARVPLHGLQPVLAWPSQVATDSIVLWALLPHPHTSSEGALEQRWRQQLSQGQHACTVHMLYGNAAQQAKQLAPWIQQASDAHSAADSAECWECLDAASEQKLFQHLLQRT